MAVLLDTHVLLWAAAGDPRVSPATLRLLAKPESVHFSVVNLWEVVIKSVASRLPIAAEDLRRQSLAAGLSELPVRGHHVLEVARLPALHRDPFDRILLAQASSEGMRLLTVDAKLLAYGAPAERA